MGNTTSEYNIVDENKQEPSLPKINPFHCKGKPYGTLLEHKLKSKYYTRWSYYDIYDLRNGKSTWWLDMNVNGDILEFKLHLIKKDDTKDEIISTLPLRYNSRSNNYMTVLKGRGVELELYADNIHSQRLENLKLETKFFIYGFIRLDGQDKIPIAF